MAKQQTDSRKSANSALNASPCGQAEQNHRLLSAAYFQEDFPGETGGIF